MYNILTQDNCQLRSQLAGGVVKMLRDISKHPAVDSIERELHKTAQQTRLIERALILAALVFEPNFLQHILLLPNMCSSTISEFTVQIAQAQLDEYVCGKFDLAHFVENMTHLYIIL